MARTHFQPPKGARQARAKALLCHARVHYFIGPLSLLQAGIDCVNYLTSGNSQPAYLPRGERLLALFALNTAADEKHELVFRQSLAVVFALLCWLVVPVVLSYIASQGSTRLFSTRYLVVVVPPLFLPVGLGVSTLHWRAARIALTLALIGIALYYVPAYYRSARVAQSWLDSHYHLIGRIATPTVTISLYTT